MTVKPKKTNLAASSVCCFHPVNTPAGVRITDLAPGDHHHHRGIFFAWHTMEFHEEADFSGFGPLGPTHGWDIHRGDFWGWGSYAPVEGRVIRNQEVTLLRANARRARLRIHNTWEIHERNFMDEVDLVDVREREGAFIIDLHYRFKPLVKMVLNENPFGGFCVRARNDGDSAYFSPRGKVTLPDGHYSAPDLNWPAEKWYDFTIDLRDGPTAGVAVIDYPDNPPTTWHNPRYIWMINPVIMAEAPVVVEGGQALDLRYRIVVHDGPTPTALLNRIGVKSRPSTD
jgi:hypothetical protein